MGRSLLPLSATSNTSPPQQQQQQQPTSGVVTSLRSLEISGKEQMNSNNSSISTSSSSRSTGSSRSPRIDLIPLQADTLASDDVTVLSDDPLVYVIHNLLSPEECQSYRDYVLRLEHIKEEGRSMTRSNPPEVSLDVGKLWPLPFLSLAAGIPPLLRWWQAELLQVGGGVNVEWEVLLPSLASAVVPPILVAAAGMALLALGVVVPLLRIVSRASLRTSVAVALNTDADFVECDTTDTAYALGSAGGDEIRSRGMARSWWTTGGGVHLLLEYTAGRRSDGGETYFGSTRFGCTARDWTSLDLLSGQWHYLECR